MPEIDGIYRMNPAHARQTAEARRRSDASDEETMAKGMGTEGPGGFVHARWGPFHCGGCHWMEGGACHNKFVVADKNITKRNARGLPIVDEGDCSNHYWKRGVSTREYLAAGVS